VGTRKTGTVKWFSEARRFGFITRDAGPDIFFHYTGIRFQEGDRVSFEIIDDAIQRPQAVEVCVVGKDLGAQAAAVFASATRGRRGV
jgi:cold shock protein